MESHLLQMRGLKQRRAALIRAAGVASFTDAWIETPLDNISATDMLSHLLQMRGLKHPYQKRYQHNNQVASFTDAWIETQDQKYDDAQRMSHLLQMRGLKHTPTQNAWY